MTLILKRFIARCTAGFVAIAMALSMVYVFSKDLTPFVTAHAAVTPIANPALRPSCGQNVAIVVDLSGSMNPLWNGVPSPDSSLSLLRTAAVNYVETLKGSNAQIALYTFGTRAPNVGDSKQFATVNANHSLTSVQTEAGAQLVEGWIKGWQADGWTRWDLGLQQVADSSENYDYVLFISDGHPTNDKGNDITDQDGIITAANNVKAKGTRIIAIYAPSGTGAEVTDFQISNLEAISGTTRGEANVALNDYYLTDWSKMVGQLQTLSTLCASSNTGEVSRTIHYVDVDGTVMAPDVVQTVSYTKTTNLSSGEVTYEPANLSYPLVESPVIPGYAADRSRVEAVSVPAGADSKDLDVTVVYMPNAQRAVVQLVDDDTGAVIQAKAGAKMEITGTTGAAVGFTEEDARNVVPDGYEYVWMENVDRFDNDDAGVQTITVYVRYVPAFNNVNSSWTVVPTTSAASGTIPYANGNSTQHDYWTATLTANDQNKIAMAALDLDAISFTVNVSEGVTISSPVTNNDDGTYSVTISSTVASDPVVTLTYDGQKVGQDKTIQFQPGVVCVPSPTSPCDPNRAKQTRAEIGDNDALANGIATDSIVVYAFDANGNPTAATFTLTSVDGTVNLSATSVPVSVANNTRTITGTSNTIGQHGVSVSVADTPLQESPLSLNYVANAVSAQLSTLEIDRTTQVAGQYVVATVTARDSDNHTLANIPIVVTVDKSATLGDAKEKSYTCTTTSPSGTCSVALTDSTAEQVTVRAMLSGTDISNSPAKVDFTIGSADARMSTITAQTPRNANGADASLVTVTLKDSYGNSLTTGGDVVTMSTTLGTLTDVSDKGNGTYTANLTSTTPGTATLGFTVNGTAGLDMANVVFNESPFSAANSNWTLAPMSASSTPVANGADYWIGTLNAKDGYGVPLTNLDPTKVRFTTNSSAVAISEVKNAGSGMYTVKFTSTKSGDALANVTYDGSEQVKVVNQQMFFQAGPMCVVTPDEPCSGDPNTTTGAWVNPDYALADGSATDTVNVEAFDKYGNPTAATFVLATKDGLAHLAATTLATTATTPVRTTTATSITPGSRLVSVTANGIDLPDVALHYIQTEVNASMSTLAVDRTTQAAGSPVMATVTARDAAGRTLADVTIQIAVDNSATLGDAKVKLYDCDTTSDGTCEVALTDEKAETVSVTASVNTGQIGGSPQSVVFTAATADPTTSTITADPDNRLANGAQASVITVTLKDRYGNTLATGGDTVTITKSLGTLTSVRDLGNGTYTANLSSTTPGVSAVGFMVNDADGDATATVTFNESPFEATNSWWTVSPTTSATSGAVPVANGNAETDYWTGTLFARDAYGVALTELDPTKVSFTSSADVMVSDVTNVGDGTYTGKFTSLKAGNQVANVTYDGSDQVRQINQSISFQPGPVCVVTDENPCSGDDDTTTKTWVDPNGALADGIAPNTINVRAFDENGNSVTETFDLIDDGQVNLTSPSVTTMPGTISSRVLATSTEPGDHTIGVSVDGTSLPDLALNYVPTEPSTTMSTLVIDRTTQAAGDPITATVTARDSGGRTLPDIPIQITVNNSATIGDAKVQSHECRTESDGTCIVTLTDETAEQVTITASVNTGPINGSPKTVTFQATTADAAYSTIAANPTNRTANGSEVSVVTVTLKDRYSNTLTSGGDTVTMSKSLGALTNVRDAGDGTYTANLTSTTPGISTVGFAVNGTESANTTSVEFVPGEFCAANSTWSVAATTTASSGPLPVANGNASTDYWTGTLYAADCFGIPLMSLDTTQVHFAAESSDVVISSVENAGHGAYTVKFTSLKALDTKASVTYGDSAKIGPTTDQTISFQAGPICIPDDGVNPPVVCSGDPDTMTRAWIDPNGALADGSATNTVHVQAFDANGNPVDATFDLTSDSTVNLGSSSVSVVAGNGKNTTTAASTKAGNHDLGVWVDGTPLPGLTLIYVQTAVSEKMSTLEVDTPVQTAGGVIMATVTAKDSDGRVLEGIPIQVSVDKSATLGDQNATTYECLTTADGTCSVAITDTVAEPVTVTATVNVNSEAVDIAGSPMTVTFVAGSADPNRSTISVDETNRASDGQQASVVTVTLKDHFGNQLTTGGDTVTMSKTLGNLTSVTDMGDGTYTANLTSTVTGASVIGYAVDGSTGNGIVTVTFIDTTAPDSPTVTSPKPGAQLKDPTPEVVGKAEPGSTVTVKDSNEILCTTIADADGNYSCAPDSEHELVDGPHTLAVTATDPSGNASQPTEVPITIDTIPPSAPVIGKANGTEISGRAEPGSIISVTVPGVADPIPTTADENGDWLVLTPIGTIDNSEVSATATDAAGNESEPGTAVIDITAPDKPVIEVANATKISGTAEPDSIVTVRVPMETLRIPGAFSTFTTTAASDGTWSIDTPRGAMDGGIVTATATDRAGNISPQATRELDLTPPEAPVVETANGSEISGTADPDSIVTITVPGVEDPITTTAGPDGDWSVDTPEGAEEGTIHVTATDPAGNTSPETTHHIDVTPPDAPIVEKANATEVSGTAEKGSTVTVVFPDGTEKTTTADPGTGVYSVTTPAGMPDGGQVAVTATDEAGNVSSPTYHALDTKAPDAPVIDRADAHEISGTAEEGSIVTIRVPGVPGTITVTVGDGGQWKIETPSGATDGTVFATATDEAGNISDEATRQIDVTAPGTPIVNPSNGSEVTGKADPGSMITITDENGETVSCKNTDGTVSSSVAVDQDGKFVCVPEKALTPGSSITVIATDGSGLPSAPVTVTIGNVSIEIAYPQLHRLDSQVVTGHRFNQGEQVCLVVHSDPLEVGCDAADDQGTVTLTFQVPAGFDLGDHTVTLTGQSSKLSASTSFTVVNTPEVRTGGASQLNSDALIWAVTMVMICGTAVSAMGIRRSKMTK